MQMLFQIVKKKQTYFAHDESSDCNEGDLVLIKESQRISKKKNFQVIDIIERSQHYTNPVTGKTIHQHIN